MTKPKQINFTAVIQKFDDKNITYIDIDFDVEKTFGKKRLKIKVWFDKILYRGLLTKYDGVFHIIINQEIRAKIGKNAGDTISVKIEEDLDERTVELPKVMLDFFKTEKALKDIFSKLSYTHQKEYAAWLSSAKKPETLLKRVDKFKAILEAKNTN